MSWALERRAPMKLYLLLDDQPPRMMAYTVRLVTAKMKTMPMSMPGAITNWYDSRYASISCAVAPGAGSAVVRPNGTTAKASVAVPMAMAGAARKSTLSA